MRSLSATTDRAAVARLFADAADYVLLEDGRAPDEATMDNFFNERPPNVGAADAVHIGMFDADRLLGILGVVFGYPEANDSYIGLLLLAPHARGGGVGGRALAHATTLARARGSIRQLVGYWIRTRRVGRFGTAKALRLKSRFRRRKTAILGTG